MLYFNIIINKWLNTLKSKKYATGSLGVDLDCYTYLISCWVISSRLLETETKGTLFIYIYKSIEV